MKWLADEIDKEVWNSEEQATFSNSAFCPATTDKSSTVEGTGIGACKCQRSMVRLDAL